MKYFLPLLLTGCASLDLPPMHFDHPKLHLDRDIIQVKVFWHEENEMGLWCPPDQTGRRQLACSVQVTIDGRLLRVVHTVRPKSFDDWQPICILGHEVAHEFHRQIVPVGDGKQ